MPIEGKNNPKEESDEGQQEGQTSDDTGTSNHETSSPPEMEASVSMESDDDSSSPADVEKGFLKEGDLDSDTDETVSLEDITQSPWVPVWFLNHGWQGVLAILIPILFIVMISSIFGYVFSSSSETSFAINGQVGSNVDLSLISTPSPTTSSSPTSIPPTPSPTFAPTTLKPSAMPSLSPSEIPTIAPTIEPVVSHDFMVRLYWHPEFYWQETYEETWWCMECAECKRFNLGDGWEGDCVSPGDTPASCDEGDQIWVRKCKDKRRLYTFEVINNFGSGDQVRVHGTLLCFSMKNEIYLELRTCDRTKPEQLFTPIENTKKFELRPYDERGLSDREANCLSQRHHPKDKEMVGMFRCRTNINHETNYWTEFYR